MSGQPAASPVKVPANIPAGAPTGTSAVEAGAVELDAAALADLHAMVEATARTTGEQFFQSLVQHLCSAIDVHFAFVAEFAGVNTRVRTLAYWSRDHIEPNIEFDLDGTPCEDVVRGKLCHHPAGVKNTFPLDQGLVDLNIEGYLGVPLLDVSGRTLGHLAVFDDRPMTAGLRRLFILQLFAARATAELERLRDEAMLRESEARYKDLYEEAPIAYVSVGMDGRLASVNRCAEQLFAAPAAQLVGVSLESLFPAEPTAQSQATDVRRRILAGEALSGLELELRRADGRPLWVSLWLKPMLDREGRLSSSRMIAVDITERVLAQAEQARLRLQNVYLQEELKAVHNFEEIIGRTPALTAVLDQVRQVAPTDATVLIRGETGSGKELIARAIHSHSRRQDKPLIKLNCAALPTGLVESELFGHEKGAFTGAIARRLGRFELAQGGTIFLDEIGELPLDVQAKLLRVLQEREFERVGGDTPLKVDVRVIAATNRDLLKMVREGTFREDLYYRLSVFPVALPALRERRDDIPLLVHFLLEKSAQRVGKRLEGVDRDTMQRLIDYPWPGNVRELENVVERWAILSPGPHLMIAADNLQVQPAAATAVSAPAVAVEAMKPPPTQPTPPADAADVQLESVERAHIKSVLEQTRWVIEGSKGAAAVLGLHPSTLRSRMKKLGIAKP